MGLHHHPKKDRGDERGRSEGNRREERRTEEANTRGGCISLLSLIIVDTTKNPVNV